MMMNVLLWRLDDVLVMMIWPSQERREKRENKTNERLEREGELVADETFCFTSSQQARQKEEKRVKTVDDKE